MSPNMKRTIRWGGGIAVLALLVVWISPAALWQWREDVLFYTAQHLLLVSVSMVLAITTGVVAGVVFSRPGIVRFGEHGMQLFSIGNTVPPMAVLSIALALFGIGYFPALIALWLASLLPIVRNTYQGLRDVDAAIKEAATGIGLNAWQQLWHVELPNALPSIMSGIRISLAVNVGTAPLSFLIGAMSLGNFIFPGIALNDTPRMVLGAALTALLALILDKLAASMTHWLSPHTHVASTPQEA